MSDTDDYGFLDENYLIDFIDSSIVKSHMQKINNEIIFDDLNISVYLSEEAYFSNFNF